jgi:hypothetical protein
VNPRQARRVRSRTTTALEKRLRAALGPFLGKVVSEALLGSMGRKTRPLVAGARKQLRNSAVSQYKTFLDGGKPLSAPTLTKFSNESWVATLAKVTEEVDSVTEDVVDEIVRKGEYWARDAEHGTLIDYAIRDDRVEGWARVDPEPPACPFCTVLISIGPTRTDPLKAHFHTGDTCEIVLVGPDQTDYEGADQVKAAQEEYERAAKAAGSTDMSALVRAIKASRGEEPPESERVETQ